MSDSATLWTIPLQAPLSMRFSIARILEWVAISSSRGSSQPRESNPCLLALLALEGRIFTTSKPPEKPSRDFGGMQISVVY